MPEPGGSTTQSGILFQNAIAARYLGRMLDQRPFPDNERVVEVRVEAPEHVDDVVVTFADGHRLFIQVKEDIRPGSDAWKKLWADFEGQRRAVDFRPDDRLVLFLGNYSANFELLDEICLRAQGSKDSAEWLERLSKGQAGLLNSIRTLLFPAYQDDDSVWQLFAVTEIRIETSQMIEETASSWMPRSSVDAGTLFSTLVSLAAEQARNKAPFTNEGLRVQVKKKSIKLDRDREVPRDRKMEILLNRVQADWIQDFLEKRETAHAHFTNGSSLIPIHKRWASDLLAQPPAVPVEISPIETGTGARGEEIPPDTSLLEVFEQAGSLLILGEPGSGKTMLLLELARFLVARAEADPNCPVPVVLQLASWGTSRKPLDQWIVDELNNIRFGIPRPDSLNWLESNGLSLLLDGLDEISEDVRDDCVRAINQFVKGHGLVEIAVTCRTQEYQVLADRLSLRRAICLQALTWDQVQVYFDAAGPALQGLRKSLEEDAPLQEMAKNPLMLYMLSAIYENEMVHAPVDAALEDRAAWRKRLFGKYVKTMLRDEVGKVKPFDDTQTTRWLSWLAGCLDTHKLDPYSLDQMQPSWLPSSRWAWAYMFASRLSIGLAGGLMGSILVGLGLRQSYSLQKALSVSLVEGLFGGFVAGIAMALVDMGWIILNRRRGDLGRLRPFRSFVLRFLVVFLAVFMVVSLAFALLDLVTSGYGWLYAGLQLGVLFGLCAALLFAFGSKEVRTSLANDIQTVERLSWTSHAAWRGALLGGGAGALAGAVMGLFFGCFNPLVSPLCRRGFTSGDILIGAFLIAGIFAGLIGFIFGGLGGTFLKIEKVTPDQGIHISLANALKIGGGVGLLFGVAGALVAWLVSSSLDDALTYGLYGLFVGVLAALYYGGLFVIQHQAMRSLLWLSGYSPRPWRLVEFLDYAAQCIFLQRVGGAYRFFHRYLQEYFMDDLARHQVGLADDRVGR